MIHRWDDRDPVEQNWITSTSVTIHKFSASIQLPGRKVYYRPTTGPCTCRFVSNWLYTGTSHVYACTWHIVQFAIIFTTTKCDDIIVLLYSCTFRLEFDGQELLLFNLDNLNLFYYDFLFNYLHLMLEGHNPLAAYMRVSQRSQRSQSLTHGVSIATLRRAWNSFARLLDLDFENSFLCPVCGTTPNTVICDGTMLGFRKDLITACSPFDLQEAVSDEPLLKGSKHSDRVLIKKPKERELLLKCSGISRDRKRLQNPKPLSQRDFTCLQNDLVKDGLESLANLLRRLRSAAPNNLCPESYRAFLSELARNSPVCGLVQLGETKTSTNCYISWLQLT